MLVAVIPPALTDPIRYEDVTVDLEYLQKQVGGYIESLHSRTICMTVDEEYRLKEEQHPNVRATAVARMMYWIPGNDWIGGTAVLTGPVVGSDFTDLPAEMRNHLDHLQKHLAAAVN
jgi:hypothetical protein